MRIVAERERKEYRGLWVLGEIENGRLTPASLELVSAARALADADPDAPPVWGVLFGADVKKWGPLLARHGADATLVVEDPSLDVFNDEDQARLLERLLRQYRPAVVLTGATPRGRALAPRVAVSVHSGLTADCTGLALDPVNGALLQTRPAFGGNLMATIRSEGYLPQFATVRPGVMKAAVARPNGSGRIIRENFLPGDRAGLKEMLESVIVAAEKPAVPLHGAAFIVTGGRGMKSAEGFRKLHRLAERIGGAVGATRAVVDAGWAPYAAQIGQTGATVHPKVYLACGVSGQIQHLVGMQNAGRIIAVNRDPDAPIMQVADVAVVGDAVAVVERLLDHSAEFPFLLA